MVSSTLWHFVTITKTLPYIYIFYIFYIYIYIYVGLYGFKITWPLPSLYLYELVNAYPLKHVGVLSRVKTAE